MKSSSIEVDVAHGKVRASKIAVRSRKAGVLRAVSSVSAKKGLTPLQALESLQAHLRLTPLQARRWAAAAADARR